MDENDKNRLNKLVRQADDRNQQLKKSIEALEESLDYLRVVTKYLLFDLEATRRENAYLRKQLEEKGYQ